MFCQRHPGVFETLVLVYYIKHYEVVSDKTVSKLRRRVPIKIAKLNSVYQASGTVVGIFNELVCVCTFVLQHDSTEGVSSII